MLVLACLLFAAGAQGAWKGVDYGQFGTGYLGIQYANIPGRWMAPQLLQPPSSSVDATSWGPGCPQVCALPEGTCPDTQSEQCLSLNVYVPNSAKGSVLVFLPGGAFEQGTSGVSLYDARKWATSTGVIVVTVNYRVGALGWLTSDDFGLQDQRAALRWVQKNIASFGGDPSRVTLAGESAGATSVAVHNWSPASAGLFSRVVIQSAPWGLPLLTKATGSVFGTRFANNLNCAELDLSCMRSKSLAAIVEASDNATRGFNILYPYTAFLPIAPHLGPQSVSVPIVKGILEGKLKSNAQDILWGNVNNEGVLFIDLAFPTGISKSYYRLFLAEFFKARAFGVSKRYPPSGGTKTLAKLATDWLFACPLQVMGQTLKQQNVYLYRFQHQSTFTKSMWKPLSKYGGCTKPNITCHGTELVYEFDSLDLSPVPGNMSAPEQLLANRFGGAIGRFANGLAPWNASLLEVFATDNVPPAQNNCNFWRKFY